MEGNEKPPGVEPHHQLGFKLRNGSTLFCHVLFLESTQKIILRNVNKTNLTIPNLTEPDLN
jgi:hypothetical protein